MFNRPQCIVHELIFEPRHGALMSKCIAIRRSNSNAKILDWPSSIVKDRVLEAFMKISRGLRNSRSVRESEGGSRGGFVHYICMILQVHFSCQGSFAPGMRTRNRLMVRMVAEMLTMEMLLQVAAAGESFQAISCR